MISNLCSEGDYLLVADRRSGASGVGAAEAEAVVDLLDHGQEMVDCSAVLAAVSWTRNPASRRGTTG